MRKWLALLFLLPQPAMAADPESAWFVSDTASKRFPDAEVAGPSFTSGTRVVVLLRDGERVRVSVGDRYGWVPSASLVDKAPPGANVAPPSGVPGLPDLKSIPLEGLNLQPR